MSRCTGKVTMSSETSWLFHGLSYCLLSPLIKSRLSPARQVLPIVPGKSFIPFVFCKFAGNGRVHSVQRGRDVTEPLIFVELIKYSSEGVYISVLRLYSAGIEINKRWKH